MKVVRQLKQDKRCEDCGLIKDDVALEKPVWIAWGAHTFDFNWGKYEGRYLCQDCYENEWMACEYCSAIIESWHYGKGYLPDSYDNKILCPECAKKRGFKIKVNVGLP